MPKAGKVLKAILKGGWDETSCRGSHHKMRKGSQTRIFSYHDKEELGQTQLSMVAKEFGMTLEELKQLL
jgi:predicted RNA binding protein YcfA (HicA-like mRNA interferase family)